MRKTFAIVAGAMMLFLPNAALAFQASPVPAANQLTLVDNGCGPGWYRGPGGACHPFGRGPYPGGYFGAFHNTWNGCPGGWYRGPGGACHPYGRGPFPGGYWGRS